MEQIKRQRSNSFNNYDDNKRKKIQVTTVETNCLSREIITNFEDLSNELIYEIFEFLEFHHVYKAFFNLNTRFQNLLTNSTLPLKINLSSISKSTFQRYLTDIIIPNEQRIKSIRLSNLFMYDCSLLHNISKYPRLETLILDNIESYYIENLLNQLTSLPFLSSLVINSVDRVRNTNTIYRQIFRLSSLKYCKLSMEEKFNNGPLPFANNEYSSIEHLIITNSTYLDELNSLLSYVPQLRRLSLNSLQYHWGKQTKLFSITLEHVTHVSLNLNCIKFDQFEQMIRDLFPNVQVLCLRLDYTADLVYMDANKWKQLILSHIPKLRIFDIRFDISVSNNNDQLAIEDKINQFTSPFWIEQQWFFAHQYCQTRYGNRAIFYSTNPYRSKHYTLYKQLDDNVDLHHYESNLVPIQHVYIQSEKSIINCTKYFSNATELTFKDGFSTTRTSIVNILRRIIPLRQLTKLVIECHHFSFKKMIELLYFTPNIHTLIFESMPFYKNDDVSIQQSETFRLVSNTNTITNVTFKDKCTLEKLKLLVALCPRLEYLTINTLKKDLEPIIRFLLEKTNENTSHLFSLCFSRATTNYFQNLDAFIKSETLLDDYMLKLVGSKLYLWW